MQQALLTSTPQLKLPVGAVTAEEYLCEMGFKRLGWRALRRDFIFAISGQKKFEIKTLAPIGKRGLWLYFGEGQIGDALMDLAPRSLLKDHRFRIDLLTDKNISQLFKDDPWFETVTDDISMLSDVNYDFAIVLSNKRRSIKIKRKYFNKLPWVSILESFSGPDFHRAGYATQRLSDLLDVKLNSKDFTRHSNQKLIQKNKFISFENQTQQKKSTIALCIGGVDPLRTFTRWIALISVLINFSEFEFLLIGSSNGINEANLIIQNFEKIISIKNFVGKCSILQSHDLFSYADIAICPDGGLMHLCATTTTPMIALFGCSISPEWRLPIRSGVTFISSLTEDINDISLELISNKIISSIKNK